MLVKPYIYRLINSSLEELSVDMVLDKI